MNDILTSKPSMHHKPSYKQTGSNGTFHVETTVQHKILIGQIFGAYMRSEFVRCCFSKCWCHIGFASSLFSWLIIAQEYFTKPNLPKFSATNIFYCTVCAAVDCNLCYVS